MRIIRGLKSGLVSEQAMHITIMDWVRLHPLLKKLVLHFPNEGRRTLSFGKLLKNMGMRAGVSDLFIAMGRHGYIGAWIELKSQNGVLSSSQKDFLEDMKQQNYFTRVCWSIEEAITIIQWYCFEE